MALTATIYNLDIDLADIDRAVYERLELRIARQPSETVDYMLMRLFAYCLEYREGIALTEGVAAGDEPAVLIRDLTGRINAWIEVGMPDADRLHRGHKLAGRVAVYTHRDVRKLLAQLAGANVHRLSDIPIFLGSAMGFFIGDYVYRHHHAPSKKSAALMWTASHINIDFGMSPLDFSPGRFSRGPTWMGR
jgi:uncharacterized protein YaeQ